MASWIDVVLGLAIAIGAWEGLHWLLNRSDEACGPEDRLSGGVGSKNRSTTAGARGH